MANGAELLAGLGEIEEYSDNARVLLPVSYYIANIPEVEPMDVSDEGGQDGATIRDNMTDRDGRDVLVGGTPHSNVLFAVVDGPFKDCRIKPRLYFTPGKGRNIGFVNSMVKAVTGQSVDLSALKDFGFIMPATGSPDEFQKAFAENFYTLSADDRCAFMTKYCRWAAWGDRDIVIKVSHEEGRRDEATGVVPLYNRVNGIYSMDHPKRGASFVRGMCHEEQEAEGKAQGLLA